VRLLDGAPFAFRAGRFYAPHAFWVATKFLHHFLVWWNAWILRDVDWNLAYFMLQLGTPVVLYLQASVLVTSNPNEVSDWREHFYSTRKSFFGLNMLFALLVISSTAVPSGITPAGPIATAVAIVALSLVGFRSESHRVQVGIACFALCLNLGAVWGAFTLEIA
jgi:hypothetical protein